MLMCWLVAGAATTRNVAASFTPFSAVGATVAEELVRSMRLIEINGNDLEPVEVPPGTPACEAFDGSGYTSEAEGNKGALEHHQAQLKALGVQFGSRACPHGYQVLDTGNVQREGLVVQAGGKTYRGNCDGCITPFGVAMGSAFSQCIIAYEHRLDEEVEAQAAGVIRRPCSSMSYAVCTAQHSTAQHSTATIA